MPVMVLHALALLCQPLNVYFLSPRETQVGNSQDLDEAPDTIRGLQPRWPTPVRSYVEIGNTSKQKWVLGALLSGHCTKKVQTALTFSLQGISSRDGSSYNPSAKRQLTVILLTGSSYIFVFVSGDRACKEKKI